MMRAVGDVVTGWRNNLEAALANITSTEMLAERHRDQAGFSQA
jgi:hypothetical protein